MHVSRSSKIAANISLHLIGFPWTDCMYILENEEAKKNKSTKKSITRSLQVLFVQERKKNVC